MNHYPKILLIITAAILLSGCTGRRTTSKARLDQSINTETLQPASKPILLPSKQPAFDSSYDDTAFLPLNNYLLDQDRSLEITISEYGYTRLSIEDERITDVFIYPQEAMQIKIHQQGYLILVPATKQETLSEEDQLTDNNKIQLTITGEHGTTQDFSLRLMGISPEPVRFVKTNLETSNISEGD